MPTSPSSARKRTPRTSSRRSSELRRASASIAATCVSGDGTARSCSSRWRSSPVSRRPRHRRRLRSHLRRDRARARGRAQVPRPRRGASTRHADLGAERPQHRHVRQPAGRAAARLLAGRAGRTILSSSASCSTQTTRTRCSPRAKRKSSGAAPRKTEYRLLARSGGWSWVREEVATVRGPEGKPLYTQTLLIDIGERKRADEERERLLARRARARRPGPWNASGASTSSARPATCWPRRPTIGARSRESPSWPFATIPTGASSTWSRTEAPSSESPSRAPSC